MDIEKIIREVTRQVDRADSASGGSNYSVRGISSFNVPGKLEHSLLVPDLTASTVSEAAAEARRYQIAALCVPPYYVSLAKNALRGSGVNVCAALGVPNALFSAAARLADAKDSLLNGAEELDVSINAMAIKSGNYEDAKQDLCRIVDAARGKAAVKAAVELALFNEEEKVRVLNLVKDCGAEYVKIQNVVSGKGADTADIAYVKQILGNNVKIKIDGGVKTLAGAAALIDGGADRIGLTATFKIARGIG
ncbi:MAG: deoxyribose-phosphate aldolase [Clostridiales Family XIII bacterium]|nr:deoxyribose-phosphate aldolase [Clostridiales Family XIII bacterium]